MDIKEQIKNPTNARHRLYEAIRALTIDEKNFEEVAVTFGYKVSTLKGLYQKVRDEKIDLFPIVERKPRQGKMSQDLIERVYELRNKNQSAKDITEMLKKDGHIFSQKTIERTLNRSGFSKLNRRTNKELGITKEKLLISQKSMAIDFPSLEKFQIDCPIAGIFFFIPYLIELELLDVLKRCRLPASSVIGAEEACLSMLLLKLIGNERLSHIKVYDREPALGLFAGLSVLPKPTYMSTYSCRFSEEDVNELQSAIVTRLKNKYPADYNSGIINLDFHSIPHFGEESVMEKVWCGARNKAMKGANTVFAHDSKSNAIMYTRADILRSEEADEVLKFVDYWKKINGKLDETLVFDCKFTNYTVLDQLASEGIKFITLRKRNKSLLEETGKIPEKDWIKMSLPIPKRKHNKVTVCSQEVRLKGCDNTLRQIIIKDHGRANPTFVITNTPELSLKEVLLVYAKRWHIENKIAELVSFFNLNALSSPMVIRIHFDIVWTLIADTLYHAFAHDLRRFENQLAPSIFRKFINMPGKIHYDGQDFTLKIRKRSCTPVLLGVEKLREPIVVPWWGNRKLKIEWTA